MTQVTVLTGARRRRDWSDEDRLEILREAFSPGACVADVARRHDVSRGLIYLWRRTALRQVQEAFAPAVIEDEVGTFGGAPTAEPEAAMVLEFADGRRLRIFASASPALAVAALKAMR